MVVFIRSEMACRIVVDPLTLAERWRMVLATSLERLYDAFLLVVVIVALMVVLR